MKAGRGMIGELCFAAEGLSGTERVVLRAGGFLQPGETIKPVSPRG